MFLSIEKCNKYKNIFVTPRTGKWEECRWRFMPQKPVYNENAV